MNWLPAVLVLGGLIFLHEVGHFLAARAAGVAVEEFSLGFGPRLLGFRWRGTLFALRLLPILGYVRMAGMYPGDEASAEPEGSLPANRLGVGFAARPLSSRVAVIAAGPAMNFAIAFVLFAAVFGVIGVPTTPTLRIGVVEPHMPAAAAGLLPGDTILAVNGRPVRDWNALHAAIAGDPLGRGRQPLPITVEVLRAGRRAVIHVTPVDEGGPLIGVSPVVLNTRLPWAESLWQGLRQTWGVVSDWALALWALVHGTGKAQVMGPIGIGNAIDQASQTGLATLLLLAAFVSANLGLLNLLPLPALDGGRLVFLLAEWLRGGRRIDPAKEGMVHLIGLAVLVGLIIIISVNDLAQVG